MKVNVVRLYERGFYKKVTEVDFKMPQSDQKFLNKPLLFDYFLKLAKRFEYYQLILYHNMYP